MSRVLVAEDDSEMRSLVVEALRKDGHTVIEAKDGGQLRFHLAELRDRGRTFARIDVIVSDIRMPVCNGLEVVEQLTADGVTIPSILMTAFGDDDTRRRAERVGALLLDKPLAVDELQAAVKRVTAATRHV